MENKEIAKELVNVAKMLVATNEAKTPDRREPESHPGRSDLKKRYKKRDIRTEDKEDYDDTLFDKDMDKD